MRKEYRTVVLNGYTTKFFLDKALNELAEEGFRIHSTVMEHIIILEKDIQSTFFVDVEEIK